MAFSTDKNFPKGKYYSYNRDFNDLIAYNPTLPYFTNTDYNIYLSYSQPAMFRYHSHSDAPWANASSIPGYSPLEGYVKPGSFPTPNNLIYYNPYTDNNSVFIYRDQNSLRIISYRSNGISTTNTIDKGEFEGDFIPNYFITTFQAGGGAGGANYGEYAGGGGGAGAYAIIIINLKDYDWHLQLGSVGTPSDKNAQDSFIYYKSKDSSTWNKAFRLGGGAGGANANAGSDGDGGNGGTYTNFVTLSPYIAYPLILVSGGRGGTSSGGNPLSYRYTLYNKDYSLLNSSHMGGVSGDRRGGGGGASGLNDGGYGGRGIIIGDNIELAKGGSGSYGSGGGGAGRKSFLQNATDGGYGGNPIVKLYY